MSTALVQTAFNAPYTIDETATRIWVRGKFSFTQSETYIAGGLLPNLSDAGILSALQDASGQNVLLATYTAQQQSTILITGVTVSSNTVTLATTTPPAAGQYVTLSGFQVSALTPLNGLTVLVNSITAGTDFVVTITGTTATTSANPGQANVVIGPDDMEIHSVAGSGYIYQYNKANATVQVFEVPAAASLTTVLPLGELGSTIPSGVYGDTIHFVASWAKN